MVREAYIPIGDKLSIAGSLEIPEHAPGLVIFAHGSGSSRHSRRNRFVAAVLNGARLATLLLDLLTAEEEALDRVTAESRFDIELLAERLVAATQWAFSYIETRDLRVGYFGASTGAAAALVAASRRPMEVAAVVSRGGRPDLASDALTAVHAPTLLIVGGDDGVVLELNRQALSRMHGEHELVVIPRASHLFEEPGALEEVSRLAQHWFSRHFPSARRPLRAG